MDTHDDYDQQVVGDDDTFAAHVAETIIKGMMRPEATTADSSIETMEQALGDHVPETPCDENSRRLRDQMMAAEYEKLDVSRWLEDGGRALPED